MYRSDEQLFEMIGRMRQNQNRGSKAAAVAVVTPCQMMVANNPNRSSKAASTQYQTVVTEHRYNMGGSASSDNIRYKCGTHDMKL